MLLNYILNWIISVITTYIYNIVRSSNHNEINIHYIMKKTLPYSRGSTWKVAGRNVYDLFALSVYQTALRNIMASLSGKRSIAIRDAGDF